MTKKSSKIIKCLFCNNEFDVNTYTNKDGYCSKECRESKPSLTCLYCGTLYDRTKYSGYCSRACYLADECSGMNRRYTSYYSRPEHKVRARNAHLINKYGITIHDYEVLLKKQNGVCAICGGLAYKKNGDVKTLHVDHDHTTGKVRGLLCSDCNTALGGFKDSQESLLKAIKYLKENDYE